MTRSRTYHHSFLFQIQRMSILCALLFGVQLFHKQFFISTRKVLKPVQWNDVSSIVGSCILNRYFSFFGKSFILCLLECILELFWCLNDFQSSYLIIANENHPENTTEEKNIHTHKLFYHSDKMWWQLINRQDPRMKNRFIYKLLSVWLESMWMWKRTTKFNEQEKTLGSKSNIN